MIYIGEIVAYWYVGVLWATFTGETEEEWAKWIANREATVTPKELA